MNTSQAILDIVHSRRACYLHGTNVIFKVWQTQEFHTTFMTIESNVDMCRVLCLVRSEKRRGRPAPNIIRKGEQLLSMRLLYIFLKMLRMLKLSKNYRTDMKITITGFEN